ncbi:hypothetical protein RRG08_019100 [Elysia crispata]|uniref:Uncharacterized protein n=1 Tax=Elysia crispata TaxID=231223 RepID=A0AAE1A5C5_9GAST|nr:hypothetical protein RRG08_019100 [Elysia crispata]
MGGQKGHEKRKENVGGPGFSKSTSASRTAQDRRGLIPATEPTAGSENSDEDFTVSALRNIFDYSFTSKDIDLTARDFYRNLGDPEHET